MGGRSSDGELGRDLHAVEHPLQEVDLIRRRQGVGLDGLSQSTRRRYAVSVRVAGLDAVTHPDEGGSRGSFTHQASNLEG